LKVDAPKKGKSRRARHNVHVDAAGNEYGAHIVSSRLSRSGELFEIGLCGGFWRDSSWRCEAGLWPDGCHC